MSRPVIEHVITRTGALAHLQFRSSEYTFCGRRAEMRVSWAAELELCAACMKRCLRDGLVVPS